MTVDEYLIGIGKIVGNLQSLELMIRIFLADAHGQAMTFPTAKDLNTRVPVTYLTNRDSLGPLIDEFNAGLSAAENQHKVDRTIVDLRDALAHGRVSTLDQYPLQLFKCGWESGGTVEIEVFLTLDKAWIDQSVQRTRDALKGVATLSLARGYPSFKSFS